MRILAVLAAALSLFAISAAPTMAASTAMKDCAAKWSAMKADGSAKGTTYKVFSKECLAGAKAAETGKPAAAAAAVTGAPVAAPAKKPSLMSKLMGSKPAASSSAPSTPAAPVTSAATSTADTGGHPQCKKGKPCGHSCIAMDKVCHKS